MAKDDFDVQGAIKAVEAANDGVSFDNKLLASICRSVPIQKEIKGLIWGVVKEKFLWFIGALIVLLGSNFLIALVQEWAKKIAR